MSNSSTKITNKYKFHYVYRITNKVLNKHYYGVHSCNNLELEGIGVEYFSSSTDMEFIKDQKENLQNYKYKIVKQFKTRQEANEYEELLHNKFDVANNNSFYNKHNSNSKFNPLDKVSCIDLRDNTTRQIERDEFYKYNYYVGVNYGRDMSYRNKSEYYYGENHHYYGRVYTEEEKEYLRIICREKSSGSNNPRALIIYIYNVFGELMFTCHGNFEEVCRENGLPYSALRKTNGRLYQNLSKGDITRLVNNGNIKYQGWYIVRDTNKA